MRLPSLPKGQLEIVKLPNGMIRIMRCINRIPIKASDRKLLRAAKK
jgi:hypothetical protein